ncbi:hypothetical protein SUGI_0205700 [Cryptomeria japonica]|nr:hypothetical protein SUGI_0205700 [Cryptomeria japonica]
MSVHLQSSKNNLSGLIPTPVALNRPRYRNLSKNNLSGLIPTYMISKRYLEYDESPYSSFQIEWEEFAEIYPLSLGYLSGVNVYDDSRRVMLIPKEKEEASIWTFMKPFTPGMWCTIAGVMIYTALVVWLLEQKLNPLLYREMSTMEVFTLIWSAVSTMSLSQNVRIQSNLARVVIAIWLLVMSIIVTTYSSNFTSRLNAQETPKSLGVKDFLGWFIITVSVSTLVVIVFLFNLIYSSGTDPNVIGQETDPASPDPLEMLPPNDDPEEQSSVERATLQTMRISNISNSQENALVEPSSVYIPHIADEPGSMEDQNI